MRALALLAASLFLLPFATAAPPTIKSYSSFTTEQFEEIARAVLSIPQVASALPDGSLVRFIEAGVVYDEETDEDRKVALAIHEGRVSGGRVTLSTVSAPSGDAALELTAWRNFWGALVNACDKANTAKLGIRGGYIGIDGGDAAKAAANGVQTGRFDDQLRAVHPAHNQVFPCLGEKPTARQEYSDAKWYGRYENFMVIDLSGRTYLLNHLGALEGQLPSAYLMRHIHEAVGSEDTWAVSMGRVDVPAQCKDGQFGSSYRAAYFAAICMKDLEAKKAQGGSK